MTSATFLIALTALCLFNASAVAVLFFAAQSAQRRIERVHELAIQRDADNLIECDRLIEQALTRTANQLRSPRRTLPDSRAYPKPSR